jgi:hypothetical protein
VGLGFSDPEDPGNPADPSGTPSKVAAVAGPYAQIRRPECSFAQAAVREDREAGQVLA